VVESIPNNHTFVQLNGVVRSSDGVCPMKTINVCAENKNESSLRNGSAARLHRGDEHLKFFSATAGYGKAAVAGCVAASRPVRRPVGPAVGTFGFDGTTGVRRWAHSCQGRRCVGERTGEFCHPSPTSGSAAIFLGGGRTIPFKKPVRNFSATVCCVGGRVDESKSLTDQPHWDCQLLQAATTFTILQHGGWRDNTAWITGAREGKLQGVQKPEFTSVTPSQTQGAPAGRRSRSRRAQEGQGELTHAAGGTG